MTKRVFISYAKEDKSHAEKLYNDLKQAGVELWIDWVDLIPGQLWLPTIRKAISASRYFIALLSSRSVGKTGTVQQEIRWALEIADSYPEDKVFIIPLRIDDCEPSFEGLRKLHRSDLFTSYEESFKDLLRALNYETEVKPTLVEVDPRWMQGTITTLTEKGFGFISRIGTAKHLFFHSNELSGVSFSELRVGDAVAYSVKEGPIGPVAVSVERA